MGGPTLFDKICNKICAQLTHAICETHIVHHSCSRIPHYNAWEAKEKVDELLKAHGMRGQGNPATWSEALRILGECKVGPVFPMYHGRVTNPFIPRDRVVHRG